MSSITSTKSTRRSNPSDAWRRCSERVIHGLLLACTTVSVVTTVSIVVVLLTQSLTFFRFPEVTFWDFLTDTRWSPIIKPNQHFGIMPLVCGTLLVAAGSAVIAIPLGLGAAIYLSEYASANLRNVVKPLLEILAGIPSVVFGYFAVVFVSPWIKAWFPSADLFNAANASVVVGLMILPTIVSLSEDVLRAVPRSLREAAYALGATKLDVTAGVVVPAAMSGILASFLLAISRAVGETMAVTLAAGATAQLTLNPLESIQTMTAFIVEVSSGDIVQGSVEHSTIFVVGMTLFVMTLLLNTIAQWVLGRLRERYE